MQSIVTVNSISTVTLEGLWKQQFRTDFLESGHDEQPGLSGKDRKFLEFASKTATLSDSHHSIALPLKDRDIRMPNNRTVAEQRALNLKRRLTRDKDFHKIILLS